MPRRLPNLNALKAFEAAARYESFTLAAHELHVTQGAVSQQVKGLEQELGLKLFQRRPRHLVITEAGRDYLSVVREALDHIAIGTDDLQKRQRSGTLTVSTTPNFASKWLVHRLGRFANLHPSIDLRVNATTNNFDFTREDVDVAVWHGDGNLPGFDVQRLTNEELTPVCSPNLLPGRKVLLSPNDIEHYTLLHLDTRQDWSKWIDAAKVKAADLSRGPIFNQASMAIDAAVDGQGVALSRTALAAQDIISGRLVRPFSLALSVHYAYWIVCPKASATLPKIMAFRSWMLEEVAEETRLLSKIVVEESR